MTPEQDRTIPFFLGAVYESLARPLEIHFTNNIIAYGIFAGIDHSTGRILVNNFCRADSEILEDKKQINLSEIRYFVVREAPFKSRAIRQPDSRSAGNPPLPEASASDKWKPKAVNGTSNAHKTEVDGKSTADKPRGIKNDEFRTDTEISKRTADAKNTSGQTGVPGVKVFKRFANDATFKDDGLDAKGAAIGDWDQFRANKEAFGIHSQFDENDYTTQLDLKKVTKADVERAEKLAREIEGSTMADVAHTRHWQEERNLIKLKDNDDDEEALYSAVVREVPMEDAVVIKETRGVKEVIKEVSKIEVKKVNFGLKKVDPEKSKGFRDILAKSYKAGKAVAREPVVTQLPKSNLVSQLAAPTQPIQPTGMNYYGMPGYAQTMMYQQQNMAMGNMGYPPQYGYYPQGVYYNYSYPQQMYPQPGYFQPPK